MLVYHGSPHLFSAFDYSRIGENGTQEGQGIYFTDTKRIANGYGENGYVYTVKFSGQKSLSSDSVTIDREDFKKYLVELDSQTDYLSNWGEVAYDGRETVLEYALDGEYDVADSDVELIGSIANGCGDVDTANRLVYTLLGYDSIIVDSDWGNGQRLYIALVQDVIEIVSVEDVRKEEKIVA